MTGVNSGRRSRGGTEGNFVWVMLKSFWVITGSDVTAMSRLENAATSVAA